MKTSSQSSGILALGARILALGLLAVGLSGCLVIPVPEKGLKVAAGETRFLVFSANKAGRAAEAKWLECPESEAIPRLRGLLLCR